MLMAKSYKLNSLLIVICVGIALCFMFTGIKWLGYATVAAFIYCFLVNVIILFTNATAVLEIGNDNLVMKKKSGKDYTLAYARIKHCAVYPTRGTIIEIDAEDNKHDINRLTFYFLTDTDRLYSQINELSTKCNVYVWRWWKFWKGEEKWQPVEPSTTWVPFDERNKD